ncbi:MAG: hydroxymethylbilane synthase [Silicimonas sp.]|nr:hydroxymethylbilane synthase [Silicimonas sp.]
MTLPTPSRPVRIGTRGSPLALAQAHETRDRLCKAFDLVPEAFEIVVIKTTGDRVLDRPLSEIGGKGLFTKEIEEALLDRGIDLAVHSMKDMPVDQPAGLLLDVCLPREDVRDAFVTLDGTTLADLPKGTTVGTSSLRRRAQLLHRRPDLRVVEFRGNVQTRLGKLENGVAKGTFLALAGLRRLGLDRTISAAPIGPDDMLPAVAQGAIGIERRLDDDATATLLDAIRDRDTETRIGVERAFLRRLDGSCQTPIAGLAEIDGERLRFRGEILKTDGSAAFSGEREGAVADGGKMGVELAEALLDKAGTGFFSDL